MLCSQEPSHSLQTVVLISFTETKKEVWLNSVETDVNFLKKLS